MSRIFLCITSNPSESFSIFIFEFLAPKNRTSAVDFVYLVVMNPPAPDPHKEIVGNPRQRRELTDSQRDRIVSCLLWELQSHGQNGRFARGTVTVVANEFYVCSKTIRRVWARALENFQNPEVRQFRSNTEKKRCGRHRKWNHEEVREAVRLLPLFQRKTIRDLAAALKIPKSTVHLMKMDSMMEGEVGENDDDIVENDGTVG